MVVYPDFAFLLGAEIYGAVLFLSLRFLGLSRARWKFFLAVFLSAASAALSVLPQMLILLPIFMGFSAYVLLFYGKNGKGTLLNLGMAFLVTVLYIGLWILFSVLVFSAFLLFSSVGTYFILSFPCGVFGGILAFFALFVFLRRSAAQRKKLALLRCSFFCNGRVVSLLCYPDSGNFLRDPLTDLPVVIVEYRLFLSVFGKDFPRPMSYDFSSMFGAAARVVPYRTVDGDGRLLSAFVCDAFFVGQKQYSAVIAVTESNLECQGRFSGLLGPDLMKGEE